MFFFFKQKTAYEMRISDWSSDVCSSDLLDAVFAARHAPSGERLFNSVFTLGLMIGISDRDFVPLAPNEGIEDAVFPHPARIGDTIREIGRASCRERVCQYV